MKKRGLIMLSAVPEPYRTLAYVMHSHGKMQECYAIWKALDKDPCSGCVYTPEAAARDFGWICGLEFRIKEILTGCEPK